MKHKIQKKNNIRKKSKKNSLEFMQNLFHKAGSKEIEFNVFLLRCCFFFVILSILLFFIGKIIMNFNKKNKKTRKIYDPWLWQIFKFLTLINLWIFFYTKTDYFLRCFAFIVLLFSFLLIFPSFYKIGTHVLPT